LYNRIKKSLSLIKYILKNRYIKLLNISIQQIIFQYFRNNLITIKLSTLLAILKEQNAKEYLK